MAANPTTSPAATQFTYATVTFDALPRWLDDDHAAAFGAFLSSCPILIAASKAGNRASAASTPTSLLKACDAALELAAKGAPGKAAARDFFERHFVPHRVVHASPPGLITGYYEPVIEGSRTPTKTFSTPVYRRPADLVNIVEEAMRGAQSRSLTHGRKTDKGVQPYATRAEIDQGALIGKGLELAYLASPVDKFFMQVQGSGRIRMQDGTMVRVTYDGKNGHPYSSIGRHLIDSGELAADKMSLEALGRWLKADLDRARRVMWLNKSYVFFREMKAHEANGAIGVLNIPLTTGRSLAVDAGAHAIGLPIYVTAPTLTAPQSGGFSRLMVAQDVGSAIKGPERGDIYFGSGAAAGKLAGVTRHPVSFFVLLPREPAALVAKTKPESKSTPAGDIATGSLVKRADP